MITNPAADDDASDPMGRHSTEPEPPSGQPDGDPALTEPESAEPASSDTAAAASDPGAASSDTAGERGSDPVPAIRAESADADEQGGASDEHGQQVVRWRERSKRRRQQPARRHPWWVELPVLVVVAFLITFLIQTFVARVYYVPSGSMEHTLHGTEHGGDRILAFKTVYDFRDPKPGEVVVFKGPATWTPEASIPGPSSWLGKLGQSLGSVVGIAPPNEKDFVKRVIAVGGQTVSCCDTRGRVQVDGVSLDEKYLFMDVDRHPDWRWIDGVTSCAIDPDNRTRYESVRCFGPYTVPKGTVWVMGDHRSDSADSSWNCRGLVPADDVQCQGPIPVDDVIGKAVFIVMPPSRWGTIDSPALVQPGGS